MKSYADDFIQYFPLSSSSPCLLLPPGLFQLLLPLPQPVQLSAGPGRLLVLADVLLLLPAVALLQDVLVPRDHGGQVAHLVTTHHHPRLLTGHTHRHVPGHVVAVRALIVPALGHEAHVAVVRQTPLQHRVIQTWEQ